MKLSSIAVPMLVLVITSLSLTNYVNIKAKKLDYTTGSDNKYYDMNTHEYYFYQLTSEVDKENYRKIQDALNNLEPKIKLKEVYTFDKMKTLIYFVLNDHPEIFWFGNCFNSKIYITGNGSTNIKYIMTKEEIEKAQYEIDMFEMELKIKAIKRSMTPYEKEVAIYDYISKNAKFDEFHVL